MASPIKIEWGSNERVGRDGFVPYSDLVASTRLLDDADEIYSSHHLQKQEYPAEELREMVGFCKAGATIELRLPHWLGMLARAPGNRWVLSELQLRRWCEEIGGLNVVAIVYIPWMEQMVDAKRTFPLLTEEQIMRFVPGVVSEVRYTIEVKQAHGR